MSDNTIAVFWSVVPWLGALALLSNLYLQYRRLHETSRGWRNFYFGLGLFGVFVFSVSNFRGANLWHAVSILQNIAATQDFSIAKLQQRLMAANQRLTHEDEALDAARAKFRRTEITIANIRASSRLLAKHSIVEAASQRAALSRARSEIATAREQIVEIRLSAALVGRQAHTAQLAAEVAMNRARIVTNLAIQTQKETDAKLDAQRALVTQAAIKAGVYHVPEITLRKLAGTLRAYGPGTATVSCAPGLENPCDELGRAIESAGWRVDVHKAVPFFTGAGLDAPTDPAPKSGLILSYRPAFFAVAKSVEVVLSEGHLFPFLWSIPDSPIETDIGILFRFPSK